MNKFYNEWVLQVEKGSFTPIVMSTSGGEGKEAARHHKRISTLIAEKRNESYADVINYVRTRLRFSVLRSTLTAIRGVRGKARTAGPISDVSFNLIEQWSRKSGWQKVCTVTLANDDLYSKVGSDINTQLKNYNIALLYKKLNYKKIPNYIESFVFLADTGGFSRQKYFRVQIEPILDLSPNYFCPKIHYLYFYFKVFFISICSTTMISSWYWWFQSSKLF